MQAAGEAGLRIPDDLSVVGFDDIETAQTADPPLTTVRQPFYEMGLRAARLLESLMADPATTERQILVEPSLRIRESTAPPPQG
jgi:DNA-binding LacI/PurR family transcriptional regulator